MFVQYAILILRVFGIFFSIIAMILAILGAFYYFTAGGDKNKVKKSKNILIYAALAAGVVWTLSCGADILARLLSAG